MGVESRKYMIFNSMEVGSIDFSEVLETSVETLRYSSDGTLTFVKWEGEDIPPSVGQLLTSQGPYSYEEMLQILQGQNWI